MKIGDTVWIPGPARLHSHHAGRVVSFDDRTACVAVEGEDLGCGTLWDLRWVPVGEVLTAPPPAEPPPLSPQWVPAVSPE